MDERTLEADLRISQLEKDRVISAIYGAICAAGCVAWTLAFCRDALRFGIDVEWLGSKRLGWVWVVVGCALLAAGALQYLRRFARATRNIAELRAAKLAFVPAARVVCD
jgi:hypothetical protein